MIDVVLCASGADEVRLVHGIAREHADRLRVVRRCADIAEAIGAVGAGIGDVVVVDLAARGLDRDALAGVIARGTAVVGLTHHDAAGGAGATTLGLRCTVDAAAPVTDVVAQIMAALSGEGEGEAWTPEDETESPGARSRIIAVWGPAGAPGRSLIAANAAYELAAAGTPTILVDADTHGPCLAQMLGIIEDAPGLLAACRAAGRDTLDALTLRTLVPVVTGRLRLLSGIGAAGRWAELRESALERVWETLALTDLTDLTETTDLTAEGPPADGTAAPSGDAAGIVVIDAGWCLEVDDDLALDGLAPQRNAATTTALAAADEVLAVVGADPISLTRLLRERERLAELGIGPIHAVVNRLGPPADARRVHDLLAPRIDLASFTTLPEDSATCRRAAWDGALLAEAGPRTPLRRGIRELALALAAPVAG